MNKFRHRSFLVARRSLLVTRSSLPTVGGDEFSVSYVILDISCGWEGLKRFVDGLDQVGVNFDRGAGTHQAYADPKLRFVVVRTAMSRSDISPQCGRAPDSKPVQSR